MSYTITVRLYQSNPNAFFKVVEMGNWHYANGGTWSQTDGVLKLTMGGSGTAGMLRFMTEEGKEAFFVAMGVHNYKPWLDVVTGLADDITVVRVLNEYYDGNNPPRVAARESHRQTASILNIDNRNISAEYTDNEGNDLKLVIIIG